MMKSDDKVLKFAGNPVHNNGLLSGLTSQQFCTPQSDLYQSLSLIQKPSVCISNCEYTKNK